MAKADIDLEKERWDGVNERRGAIQKTTNLIKIGIRDMYPVVDYTQRSVKIRMKNLIFISLLFLVSCFPSMHTGPDPHSIEFKKADFEEVISYFNLNSETKGFDVENAPSEIPELVIDKMEEIGIMEYTNLGTYKAFFCGYGVVGKGWGFIHGEFSPKESARPGLIKGNENTLNLTYIKHIEGTWYKFGAG